jgi:hypothetical protein
MRRLVAATAILFVLTAAASANAEAPEPDEPLELPTALNNVLAGFNALATFPADPVMSAIDPPEEFEDLPGAPVTSHTVGFFQGTFLMVYRLTMGLADIAFAPFWVFPTLSPEARYEIIPGYEIEYE